MCVPLRSQCSTLQSWTSLKAETIMLLAAGFGSALGFAFVFKEEFHYIGRSDFQREGATDRKSWPFSTAFLGHSKELPLL